MSENTGEFSQELPEEESPGMISVVVVPESDYISGARMMAFFVLLVILMMLLWVYTKSQSRREPPSKEQPPGKTELPCKAQYIQVKVDSGRPILLVECRNRKLMKLMPDLIGPHLYELNLGSEQYITSVDSREPDHISEFRFRDKFYREIL